MDFCSNGASNHPLDANDFLSNGLSNGLNWSNFDFFKLYLNTNEEDEPIYFHESNEKEGIAEITHTVNEYYSKNPNRQISISAKKEFNTLFRSDAFSTNANNDEMYRKIIVDDNKVDLEASEEEKLSNFKDLEEMNTELLFQDSFSFNELKHPNQDTFRIINNNLQEGIKKGEETFLKSVMDEVRLGMNHHIEIKQTSNLKEFKFQSQNYYQNPNQNQIQNRIQIQNEEEKMLFSPQERVHVFKQNNQNQIQNQNQSKSLNLNSFKSITEPKYDTFLKEMKFSLQQRFLLHLNSKNEINEKIEKNEFDFLLRPLPNDYHYPWSQINKKKNHIHHFFHNYHHPSIDLPHLNDFPSNKDGIDCDIWEDSTVENRNLFSVPSSKSCPNSFRSSLPNSKSASSIKRKIRKFIIQKRKRVKKTHAFDTYKCDRVEEEEVQGWKKRMNDDDDDVNNDVNNDGMKNDVNDDGIDTVGIYNDANNITNNDLNNDGIDTVGMYNGVNNNTNNGVNNDEIKGDRIKEYVNKDEECIYASSMSMQKVNEFKLIKIKSESNEQVNERWRNQKQRNQKVMGEKITSFQNNFKNDLKNEFKSNLKNEFKFNFKNDFKNHFKNDFKNHFKNEFKNSNNNSSNEFANQFFLNTLNSFPKNGNKLGCKIYQIFEKNEEKVYLGSFRKTNVVQILFTKKLSKSDTGDGGRIVIPKIKAEIYFPILENKKGIIIIVEDEDGGYWNFKYKFWPNNSSRMYVLETSNYIKKFNLNHGDYLSFCRSELGNLKIVSYKPQNTYERYENQVLTEPNANVSPIRFQNQDTQKPKFLVRDITTQPNIWRKITDRVS